MKKLLLIIALLVSIPAWGQDLSGNNFSGNGSANDASAQNSGVGYLDYVSGAKRPQTKNQIFTLDDFSGGLNNKGNPIGLPKSDGQIVQNVRINSALHALSKRSPVLLYGTIAGGNPILGMFRYYAYNGTKVLLADAASNIYTGNDTTGAFTSIYTLASPSHRPSWLTWNNQAIMVDGFNNDVKYDGSSASATNLGSLLAVDSGAGTGPDTGNHLYKVSCYTSNVNGSGPFEFSFNVPSNTLAATGHAANLSMIPQCPDANFLGEPIVGRYLYRTKAGASTYYELAQIANNSSVTYSDTTADGSISVAYPVIASATESSPPKGILSLVYQGRLWIANNPTNPSRVYFSEIGSQEMFLPLNYFDIRVNDGDQITMLQNVLGVITIGKNNTVQKIQTPTITGNPLSDWTITDPFAYVGCVSPYSTQNTPIGIMYLGNNGIYFFDGNFSTLLSDQVTPTIKDISPANFATAYSAFYQNQYYLAYTSSSSGSTSNNRVLIYDLLSKSFDIDTSNIGSFTVERGGTDIEILYGGDSTTGNVYSYTNGSRDIINKTQADFSGTFTNAWYVPTIAGGDSQNALLEIAQTATIDALVGTVDSLCGTVQFGCSLGGTYVSPIYDIGATSFNNLYWNETLPTAGSGVTFQIRTATQDSAIPSASYSTAVSNPSGSNISNIAGGNAVQYKINFSTDTLTNSPTVYSNNTYVVDLSYNISQGTGETTIPFQWQSGWLDFGAPAYKKSLKKIYIEYESGATGTLNVTLNNYTSSGTQTNYNYGTPVNFAINLNTNPSEYIGYFPNGQYDGELFNITLTENSLNPLNIKRIVFMYNIQPLI